jgi:hypothetical protein
MQRFKPQLTATLPDGWVARESTELLSLDGAANVIASSEPLNPDIDTQRYAEMQGESFAREFPNYREITFEPIQVFGKRHGYIRHFEWEPEGSVPLAQMQIYYTENGRGYTATATTPSGEFERLKLQLRLLLEGLDLDP